MNPVWLNGALMAGEDAHIGHDDRGLTLGDGVFETIKAIAGKPVHVDLHLERLCAGAAALGFAPPYDDTTLIAALMAVADGKSCALRLTLTRGPMARGILPSRVARPTTLITAGTLPDRFLPARLVVARLTRRNEQSPLTRIKSLNYLDSILARQEAEAAGYDDAIMLNTRGDLAEATAANVFLVIDGRLVTPPVPDGALPGIARRLMLASGRAVEATIPSADLARATSGFLTNSLGVRQIACIGGHALAPCPIPAL
jgi:branched-chain amino acid aminotransferase